MSQKDERPMDNHPTDIFAGLANEEKQKLIMMNDNFYSLSNINMAAIEKTPFRNAE